MCRDCYELELPEPTWLEQFQENKETVKMAGVVIGVPLVLVIGSCLLEFWHRKGKSL